MFDAPPPNLQRSHGAARVGLTGSRVTALHQAGSAKAMLRLPPRAPRPEVVFLNTSGGLTAGDRLTYALDVADADVIATTQTAERAYRAEGGTARLDVSLGVRDGRLDWLPQETILFDGASLTRRTEVTLTGTARFLGLETVVLGRGAMGETVSHLALDDRRIIRRDGRLLALDPLRLDDAALMRASGAALLGGARVAATLMLVEPGAADALGPIREALPEPGVTAAASALDGRLTVRALASDSWPMRGLMTRLIGILRPGGIPRVWQT